MHFGVHGVVSAASLHTALARHLTVALFTVLKLAETRKNSQRRAKHEKFDRTDMHVEKDTRKQADSAGDW